MSRRGRLFTLLVALLGLSAAALTGCGDDKPDRKALLSSTKAAELRSSLDGIEQMVNDGDCEGARDATFTLQQQVDALPTSLDTSLRDALGDGVSRLQTLIESGCESQSPTTTAPTETVPEGPTVPEEGATGEEGQEESPGKGKAKGKEKKQQKESGGDGTQTQPEEQTGGSEG